MVWYLIGGLLASLVGAATWQYKNRQKLYEKYKDEPTIKGPHGIVSGLRIMARGRELDHVVIDLLKLEPESKYLKNWADENGIDELPVHPVLHSTYINGKRYYISYYYIDNKDVENDNVQGVWMLDSLQTSASPHRVFSVDDDGTMHYLPENDLVLELTYKTYLKSPSEVIVTGGYESAKWQQFAAKAHKFQSPFSVVDLSEKEFARYLELRELDGKKFKMKKLMPFDQLKNFAFSHSMYDQEESEGWDLTEAKTAVKKKLAKKIEKANVEKKSN